MTKSPHWRQGTDWHAYPTNSGDEWLAGIDVQEYGAGAGALRALAARLRRAADELEVEASECSQ